MRFLRRGFILIHRSVPLVNQPFEETDGMPLPFDEEFQMTKKEETDLIEEYKRLKEEGLI